MLSLFQTNIANSVLIQFFKMISYTLYGSQLGQISFKVDVEPAQRFLFFVLFVFCFLGGGYFVLEERTLETSLK